MISARTIPLLAMVAAAAGCASPTYIDKSQGEGTLLGINEVMFQVHSGWAASPPDCVAILPLAIKESSQPKASAEDAAKVRLSLYAHLATQSKRVIRPQRIDHVLADVHGDHKLLAERLHCGALIEGEVAEYGTTFLGLYSRVAVGADLKLVRAADGAVLWEGSHTAVSHGGSLPLDPVGIAMGVADAASNVRDEQILRITDDLTRRLVSTIPDNAVAALDDPAEAPLATEVAAPRTSIPTDDVELGERLVADGNHAGALALADRAIQADPNRAAAWFLKGRVLLLDKDYKAAEPAVLRAVALDQRNSRYLNALGSLNAEQGAADRALAAYRMAVDMDPANAFAWYNTGVLYFNAGEASEAADAFYAAGLAYLKAGDFTKAERVLGDLRDLNKSGIPVQSMIRTIEDALASKGRRA